MIGIQLIKERGAVAVWAEAGPKIIGTGKNLSDLVAKARCHAEIDSDICVIAVPAWYNDEQRADIITQARQAGIDKPRLMNEPAAAALAFGLSQTTMPKTSMVLSLLDNKTFDVTILALRETYVEVLATNGAGDLNALVTSDSEQFFARIEPLINRALADAELTAQSLDAIILTGKTAALRAVNAQIESAFGRAPEEQPSPETVIALGAAVYSRMLTRGLNTDTAQPAAASGTGCLGVLALVFVLALSFIR